MEEFKIIFLGILGLAIGFGLWYLIFWFLTGTQNPIEWSLWFKIPYLLLGFASSSNITSNLIE